MLYTVLTTVISYTGLRLKKLSEEFLNDKTKKEIVKTVCEAVNQLYYNLTGDEKLNKTMENTKQILTDRGIKTTDLELRMLIESTVGCFKKENQFK